MIWPIDVIGLTDGGPHALPAELRAIIADAEVLCGGDRQLAFFPDHDAVRLAVRGDMKTLAESLRAEAEGGRRVVVLASGDPLLYGIGGTLRRFLPASLLRIHPTVSAVQLAWARVAEPWQETGLVSVHGRALAPVVEAARRHRKLAVLTDDQHTPATVARALCEAGIADRRAVVCERLGGPAERIIETTLAALPEQTFDPLNVLLLIASGRTEGEDFLQSSVLRPQSSPWFPGLPDGAFAQRTPKAGLITKREVRVVSLAALGLHRACVLWDIGAGSGSVAIEAALLHPTARVFAIERDPEGVALIGENCARFGTENVTVIAGSAPGVCADLPDPHAVFIGGSGGALAAMIAAATARLRPDGRLVVNLATLDGLHDALAALKTAAWQSELLQLSVARGTPIGGMTRLQALNPVFVIAAQRAEGSA